MMQTQNRFFDDFARMLGGAAGALSGVRNEMEGMFRQQLERLLANMDLVAREEFEAVQAVAQAARSRQEDLERRIAVLEAGRTTGMVGGGRQQPVAGVPRRNAAARLRRAIRRRRKG